MARNYNTNPVSIMGTGLRNDLSSLYARKGVTNAQYSWAVQTGTYSGR